MYMRVIRLTRFNNFFVKKQGSLFDKGKPLILQYILIGIDTHTTNHTWL